ncbi:AraC family transcriptional regulator, partial [Akkermansiaceae bacterium]|nr:AraC family transcriptional regulator [Akkermansiaceae bacterium]
MAHEQPEDETSISTRYRTRHEQHQNPAHKHEHSHDFFDSYEKAESLAASAQLGHLVQAVAALGVRTSKPKLTDEGTLVARVKEYVMSNLSGDLALETLAKIAQLSESHLRAIFREETGVSLGHFVKSVRLVRSTYLIDNGVELPEVAKQSGFQSLTSFTRAFRRM